VPEASEHVFQVSPECDAQFLQAISAFALASLEVGETGVQPDAEARIQDFVFCPDVPVDGGLRDTEVLRDVIHRRAVEPAAGKGARRFTNDRSMNVPD